MEEKHNDLIHSKQKAIINRIVDEVSASHPSFYYLPTSQIAAEVKCYIQQPGKLSKEEQLLLKPLSQRDIQILLSFHSR